MHSNLDACSQVMHMVCSGINWIKEGDNWPADDPHNRGVPNAPIGYPSHFSGNFWWATGAYWHTLPDGFMGEQPLRLAAAEETVLHMSKGWIQGTARMVYGGCNMQRSQVS